MEAQRGARLESKAAHWWLGPVFEKDPDLTAIGDWASCIADCGLLFGTGLDGAAHMHPIMKATLAYSGGVKI